MMMDKKWCRKCKYSGFGEKRDYWTGCTYIIKTNERRPRNGDWCYGFTPKKTTRQSSTDEYNRICDDMAWKEIIRRHDK